MTAPLSPRQFFWKGIRVPFIAPWSGETTLPGPIVRRRGIDGEGIGYADEYSRADRKDSTLWVRMAATRGVGTPKLAGMHALRQRHAMSHMLCQVCGGSTFGRPDGRHLFLVRAADGQPISEGEKTVTPPVHEACAREAVRDCPHLRKSFTAALVEFSPSWGVAGIVHDPRTLQPLPAEQGDLTFVAYDDPHLRWTLAARTVVTLQGCTTLDLEELAVSTVAV
ncbi:hypothetical protein OG883_41025 [Streptomyces sp. NBC_01142]|uniref:hypothetical protein n=1 Tax=Streptomyces sp. NBC_01142 TaxID=2975865 RepID=UPI002258D11B|nr:hypothetical protein [Streptomyces sp. NBC_01142]MCX4826057.1 hypothetical protein [Streptomyces sp. NBC_01142]